MTPRENLIQLKSFAFSLLIIKLYRDLVSQREYILSKQLLRSGTSIGANVEEAIGGYSRADFTHKMSLALKEARETKYWLRLLKFGKLTDEPLDLPLEEAEQLINILTSIVKTLQTNNS